MDQARLDIVYRIEHRHKDGSWAEMREHREHGSSDHDPERGWASRRIFRCLTCPESLTLTPGEEGGPPSDR
jgi:hypothetical protein